MVNVRKRGNVYEYNFEVAKIEGKRKRISKSGFKTKAEALKQGMIAYNEYLNTGRNIKTNEMSYSDFLDYWIDNHCKINLKYHTIEAYSNIVKNHLKINLGFYKLSQITKTTLQEFLNKVYVEKGYSKNFLNNIRKVLKCSFNYATDNEYVRVNPAANLKLPKYDVPPKDVVHIFTAEEINIILERFKNNHCIYYAFLTAYCTGLRIAEEELKGEGRADYGTEIIKKLSKELKEEYGKGFDARNLYYFLNFYKTFPNILNTLCSKSNGLLSWSHYRTLLQVFDKEAREWYENEALGQTWSVRTLQRNISSQYYYRLLKSQAKEPVIDEMKKVNDNQYLMNKLEFVKNPVIAEFLGYSLDDKFTETELESSIINNLQKFLMELRKRICFCGKATTYSY